MLREEMITVSSCKTNDETYTAEIEACYETLASQEEIYLETIEETIRARFILNDECESKNDA